MTTELEKELSVFDPMIAVVEEMKHKYDIVHDASTKEGYALVKAGVKELSSVIKKVETARKEKKSFYLESGRAIDAKAKEVTKPFSDLVEPMKAARKAEDEKKEIIKQERLEKLRLKLDEITKTVELCIGKSSEFISKEIDRIDGIDPLIGFYDLQHEAITSKASVSSKLVEMLSERLVTEEGDRKRIALEKEQAEMQERNRVLEEKQAKLEAEENERIRIAAEIKAQKEANIETEKQRKYQEAENERIRNEAIEKERAKSAQREKDSIAAKEKAERDAEDAIKREEEAKKQAEIDKQVAVELAKKQAEEAARIEANRVESERKRKEEADKKEANRREANTKHKRKIHNEALSCLEKNGIDKKIAKEVVTLIAKGLIKNTVIRY